MLADDFLTMLVCPITKQPLTMANADVLADLNSRKISPVNQVGEPAAGAIAAALINADGRWAYPIRDGIPVLLATEDFAL